MQFDPGSDQERLGVIRIGRQHTIDGREAIVPPPKGRVASGHKQLNLNFLRQLVFDPFEQYQGRREILALDGDGGFDQIGVLGSPKVVAGSVDRLIGFLEHIQLQLAIRKHLRVIRPEGLRVQAPLQ
jgi:hypothetical protein